MARACSPSCCPMPPMRAWPPAGPAAGRFGDRAYLALTLRRRPGDAVRLQGAGDAGRRPRGCRPSPPATCSTTSRSAASCRTSSPASATAAPSTRLASGASAPPTGTCSAPEEMARLFRRHPEAVARTLRNRWSAAGFPGRAALPVPGRGRGPGADPAADAGAADLGGRAPRATRTACRTTSRRSSVTSCG